jgi:hypothetical protein
MPAVNVVFDLKKAYQVGRVKLVCDPNKSKAPEQVAVYLSTDGHRYTLAAKNGTWQDRQMNLAFAPMPASHVKIAVQFRDKRGVLNEVEIWGTEHEKN